MGHSRYRLREPFHVGSPSYKLRRFAEPSSINAGNAETGRADEVRRQTAPTCSHEDAWRYERSRAEKTAARPV